MFVTQEDIWSRNRNKVKTLTLKYPSPPPLLLISYSYSTHPDIRHEFLPGTTQTPVIGFGIAKVLQSSNASFPVGSTFFGNLPWETYTTLSATALALVVPLQLDSELPLSVYNGVLGTSGFTVWDSLRRVADLKAGETIYISSAAG